MSSKTKIVVLHIKEIVYTVVFAILLIALVVLLFFMFGKRTKDNAATTSYTPGVYTSTVTLNNTTLEVEVAVDENHINSIRFSNLDKSVTTMYPLVQPTIEDIADQIYEKQSLEDIQYSEENPYTSMVITDAIGEAVAKAEK